MLKMLSSCNINRYVSFLTSGKCRKIVCRKYSSESSPQKTALYDFHVKNRGKVVNFAGFELPVQYNDLSISASHMHTRKCASIFDVSHMLQTYIRGKDCIECFETLCPADVQGLKQNSGTLTVFTTNKGGIYDDLIVNKISSDILYVVSNAAMRAQDTEIIEDAVRHFKANGKDVSVEFLSIEERSLLAVQGPKAVALVQALIPKYDLNRLYFMTTVETEILGILGCRITRCGYTGEDGVEISIPSDRVEEICEAILATNEVDMKLAGLGARDSLRLEAGLCLYGSDIDQNTTPVEAGLNWLIAKRRRVEENYPGAKLINQQLNSGVDKRRVGFRLLSGPPARGGAEIFVKNKNVGYVTSGCPSPSLGYNIGMGYIQEKYKMCEAEVQLKIRDRFYNAIVTKMPFIKSRYYLATISK